MNDTQIIETTTPKDVRAYVARVRVALSDLPGEDADELTQGMEADLLELAAEAGGLRARLGTPETYADDLRAAADLPPRAAGRTQGSQPVRSRLVAGWGRAVTLMHQPWAADLRPVGWVLRGFVGYCVVASVIRADVHSSLGWTVGAALSFWLGRATRTWKNRRRTALITVNLVAAVVGVFLLPSAFDRVDYSGDQYVGVGTPATVGGLANDGEPVTGITVYDSSGQRVDQPRAFDQNGNPLLSSDDPDAYTPPASLPPLLQKAPPATPTVVPPTPLATTPPAVSPSASGKPSAKSSTTAPGSTSAGGGAAKPTSPATVTKSP